MYLLKLALRPWRVAPMSQLFSALAVGFLLLLIGFLFWMEQGLKPVIARLQGDQVITAYLVNPTSSSTGDLSKDSSKDSFGRGLSSSDSKSESLIVDKIRVALGAEPIHRGLEIRVVNSTQFIQSIKNQYPDLGRELEDLGQDIDQVIPRYVSISGILPNAALEKVRKIPEVEFAESSKDRHRLTVGAFTALSWVVRVLMFGVGFSLLTGLIHLAKMNAYLQSESLQLLKFWGAGDSILLLPGMLSGLGVGVLGGCMGFVGWITLGHGLIRHMRLLSPVLKGIPTMGFESRLSFLLMGIGVGAILGVLAGVIGTLTAKWNEAKTIDGGTWN